MKFFLMIDAIFFLLVVLGAISLFYNESASGVVKKIDYGNNKITIEIEGEERIIVIFDNENLNVNKGDKISVLGKGDVYRQTKQIIPDKIFKLR